MVLTVSIFVSIFLFLLHELSIISKKQMCFSIGLMMFLLIGLRSTTTGGDTQLYYFEFLRLSTDSLSQAITTSPMKDIGYVIYEWIVKRLGGNFRIVLLGSGVVFGSAFAKYLYNYSDNPSLSFVMLFSFNIFQFALSALRQSFAIGFILHALIAYEDREYLKSIVFYLIAGLFHLSAYLLILIPVLKWIFSDAKRVKWTIPILLVTFIMRGRVTQILTNLLFSASDRMYEDMSSNGGLTTCIVVLIIYIFGAVFSTHYYKKHENGSLDFALLFWAAFFEIMIPSHSIFFRIAFYTLWSVGILVPRVIKTAFTDNSQFIATCAAYGFALVMYFGFTMNSVVGGYHFLG